MASPPATTAAVPPERELELLAWARNFAGRLVASGGGYGVGLAQAAELAAATDAYAVAVAAAADPDTRTQSRTALKRAARAALLAVVRPALHVIAAHAGLTAADRADLGMRPARDVRPPRTPVPAGRPLVRVDNRGRVRLTDADAPLAGRPGDASGAFLFVAVTEDGAPAPAPPVPPADAFAGPPPAPGAAWFAGMTTSTTHALPVVGRGLAGRTLWVYAMWCNRRGIAGPVSAPASVLLVA